MSSISFSYSNNDLSGRRKSYEPVATPVVATPSATDNTEVELKKVAKRRKTDFKNARKVSKAKNDGTQSAMEPEEPICIIIILHLRDYN